VSHKCHGYTNSTTWCIEQQRKALEHRALIAAGKPCGCPTPCSLRGVEMWIEDALWSEVLIRMEYAEARKEAGL
jgi:hypothetical protein